MIALKLTDIKSFMNQLLCSDTFDHFLLSEASITKDATFTIDGRINAAFYSEEEREEAGLSGLAILPYSKLRSVCYQLIRGRQTPVFFKFVLMLSPQNTANVLARSGSSYLPSDISGIFINIIFQHGTLHLTTGISYTVFSADRGLEHEWNLLIKKFLTKHAISYDEY